MTIETEFDIGQEVYAVETNSGSPYYKQIFEGVIETITLTQSGMLFYYLRNKKGQSPFYTCFFEKHLAATLEDAKILKGGIKW